MELLHRVEAALDSVRPYLLADGGDVKIVELTDDMTVILEFVGACGTCPMSTMTFRAGLEDAVRRLVPEIRHVEAVNLTPAF
jgi:Fe-S cluster biogenesis protein NfuA